MFLIGLQVATGEADKRPLLQQIVPQPTGKNGYEELLKAAEPLRARDAIEALRWEPAHAEMRRRQKMDYKGFPNLERLDRMSRLAVWKEAVERYRKSLEIAEAALKMPIWDPRERLSWDTAFPEGQTFGLLGKLFAARAYVRATSGDGIGAVGDVLGAITLGRRVGVGGLTMYSNGAPPQNAAFEVAGRVLPTLGVPELRRLDEGVSTLLKEPEAFGPALARNEEGDRAYLARSLFTEEGFVMAYFRDVKIGQRIRATLLGKTDGERRAFLDGTYGELHQVYDVITRRLGQTETSWYRGGPGGDDPQADVDVKSLDLYVDRLMGDTAPSVNLLAGQVGLPRTRLRLLRLHAKILAFQWERGRLPNTLEEAGGEAFDPLSGKPFVYERADGGYRLFSEGTVATKRVELDPRAAAS